MAKSNSEIDYLNKIRKDGGLEPLPYEENPAEYTSDGGDKSEDEVAAEEARLAEEKRIKDEEDAKAKSEEEKVSLQNQDANTPPELSEDEIEKRFLEILEKKGKKVSSIDEILNPVKELTEEEKKAAAEKEEAAKVAYWLSNGLVSKKEYDNYNRDIANPENIVFEQFSKEEKEADPNITDEELKEAFENEYSLNAEHDTMAFKRGKKRLELAANNLIAAKYQKINAAEIAYNEHILLSKEDVEYKAEVAAKTPIYKKDVEDAISAISKIKVPIGERQIAEFDVDEKTISEIKDHYLKSESIESRIANGYDKSLMAKEVEMIAVMKELPNILKKYAEGELTKYRAGIRGIVPQKPGNERAGTTKIAETVNGYDPYAALGAKRPVEN